MKILIVDDLEESRLLLHDLLENEGYELLQAADGQAALELMYRERPDMVISDIQMPRMDGFSLCERIKTDAELAGTAFVFYTGTYTEPEDERLALDLGASCFVRKPAEQQEFLAIVASVMEQYRTGSLPIPPQPSLPLNELTARRQMHLTDSLHRKTRELVASRRAYATLVSNLPGMAYRRHNNADWSMEFVSDACEALTGYPPDALLGDQLTSYGKLIFKQDRKRVWQSVEAAIQAGETFQIEYRIVRRNGALIWVWEQGRCINPGEADELLEGYVTDITTQHRAVSERNRFFQLTLDMLCIAGVDGYFKQLNPAWSRILGWSEAELLATPWIKLVHPDDRDATEQARMSLTKGREIFSFDNRFRHKDGSYRWLSWNFMPLTEEGVVYGVARDITDRIEDQRRLERLNRALHLLSVGNRTLLHVETEDQLLNEMCRLVTEEGGYCLAWVGYARHDENRSIEVMAQYGRKTDYLRNLHLTWGDDEHSHGPGGNAIKQGTTQIVLDIQADSAMTPWHEAAIENGFYCVVSLPLFRKGKPFGVLVIYGDKEARFVPEEISLLEELATDLSYGISLHRAQTEMLHTENLLQESLLHAIQSIAMTVEKRDPYTAGHQNRVSELATAIATEMQLPQEQIDGIRLGAIIHDIGKIYIPAAILNRPGRLSAAEFGIIKTHPDVGYDIVKNIHFPWPIAQMIHQHHERLDGSGYPQGLKGDEIILEARIMAVADVVEAITAHRPYRPALGLAAGLEEITKGKGQLFEPMAVDACLKVIEDGRFDFSQS